MPRRMTIAGQIEALIDRLNLSVRSQANVVTRGLGGATGFRREKQPCGFCSSIKVSTSHQK